MTNMELIFAAPPELTEARRFGVPVAHMGYRIGPGGLLPHAKIPDSLRGGLLLLSDRNWNATSDPEALAQAIAQECDRREFAGVIADFEGPVHPTLTAAASALFPLLEKQKRALYLPERYAGVAGRPYILIPTALSGGSLAQLLGEAVQKYGAGRVALDLERVHMDFRLPCPSGAGTPLTAAEFQKGLAERAPSSFFSRELCAYYYTYSGPDGLHFVLYDDACSMLQKLQTARQFGISRAVAVFPEIQDIAREIL